MIVSEVFTKHYKNHLKINEIQFGKDETVLDLKNKLIRCLNHIMSEEHHIRANNSDFKIYIPQFSNIKSNVFEIINKYVVEHNKKYSIKGEEIDDDREYVCVI